MLGLDGVDESLYRVARRDVALDRYELAVPLDMTPH